MKKMLLCFILVNILFAYNIYGSDKNCTVLKFIDSTLYSNSLLDNLGFIYLLKDTCLNITSDSIEISSGLSETKTGILYGINCYTDSCYLFTLNLDSFNFKLDTLFSWKQTKGPSPNNNIATILYSEKDNIFVFSGKGRYQNNNVNGSYITKIINLKKLDTLEFIPYTFTAHRKHFTDDLSQIFFGQQLYDNKLSNSYIDLIIYDIDQDTTYNPIPDNHGYIYSSARLPDNYIYYYKADTLNKTNLYRVKEGYSEEQITFLEGFYVLDWISYTDTSLIYEVIYLKEEYNIMEKRELIITPKD